MLRAGLSGVQSPVGARDRFLSKSPNQLWVLGFFSGVNQPGSEDSHLPASSAKVKEEWSYTSDLCAFMTWTGEILHSDPVSKFQMMF
jgi:hypothetical protein